jgi:uncharacterized protein with GYD domain
LVEEGGSGRVAAATAAVESLGGSVEAFYFQFGRDDALLLWISRLTPMPRR